MIKSLKFHIYWVVLVFCLMACSIDDRTDVDPLPTDANKVRVELNLSAQVADNNLATRASERDDPNYEVEGEMMKNWFVVIAQNGKIVDIVKNEPFPVGEAEREHDKVFVEVLKGRTTFYSFANLQPSDVGLANLKAGDALPWDFESRNLCVDGNTANFGTSMFDVVEHFNQGIPMSGKQTFELTEETKSVQLEVIRMVAKVKLQIANTTGHDITIKGLSLSDVTPNEEDNLKLFPARLDDSKVNTPTLNTSNKEMLHLTPKNTIGYVVSSGENQTICFYMNESEATAENKYFVLQLQTEDGTSTESTKTNRRYAMLDWQQINRNDYRIIPIKLDDYAIEWEVEAFSPIGVLPDVEDDGENMTITFSYYGEFHIKPKVKILSTGDYLGASDILGSKCMETMSTPSGEDAIFDEKPSWISSSASIEGVMGNRDGTAIYKLIMDVKKPNNTSVTLTRKMRFVMHAVDFSHSRYLPHTMCRWQQVNIFKR